MKKHEIVFDKIYRVFIHFLIEINGLQSKTVLINKRTWI